MIHLSVSAIICFLISLDRLGQIVTILAKSRSVLSESAPFFAPLVSGIVVFDSVGADCSTPTSAIVRVKKLHRRPKIEDRAPSISEGQLCRAIVSRLYFGENDGE